MARRLVRGAAATSAVAATAMLAMLAGAGHGAAAVSAARAVSARQAAVAPLQLAVTSISPAFAEDRQTITLTGHVRNSTSSAMSGLNVSLWSSATPLPSRTALVSYAQGQGAYVPPNQQQLSPHAGTRTLAAGSSWSWRVRLPVSDLGLSCFGVYALTAQVTTSAGQVARDPIPLPYWPSRPHSCRTVARPRPTAISWIWPLIDTPYQGPCPGLLSDALGTSIAPGGRLANLLAVGGKYSAKAGLTWAVDPALLDNVRKMEGPFRVGASARCGQSTLHPANQDARTWLAQLSTATHGQPLFATPYGDVDMAALTRQRGNSDVDGAFADGNLIARQVLGRGPVPVPLASATGRDLAAVAWPPGGVASSSVLDKLAYLNFRTVILTMPAVAPTTYTPGAVTSVLTGIARYVRVLLADHDINSLLGSAAASSRQAGVILAVKQLYLAETAEIVAEQPARPRPIVVTPPRRWDPSRRLADGLLAETTHAPWLKPTTARHLASLPAEHAFRSLARSEPRRELSARLLRQVAVVDGQVGLLESIMVHHDPTLYRAIYSIESSNWRGASGGNQAHAMLASTARYVQGQLRRLSIVGNHRVTLGGKASKVIVLIHNPLGYPVQVNLVVHTSHISVTPARQRRILILGNSNSYQIKLVVHSNGITPGTIRLSLASPNGTALPTSAFVMHVRPTNFGTVALVILAAALAVFVIASATRAIRHGRPDQRQSPDSPEAGNGEPSSQQPDASGWPEDSQESPGAGPAAAPGAGSSTGPATATGPGSSQGFPPPGLADPHNRRDHLDSVFPDRSELTSARRAFADQDPTFPAGGPTEEPR